MGVFTALPPEYESWTFPGGTAVARGAAMDAVRAALTGYATLYDWAADQSGRDVFIGRGEAYGVRLGHTRAVVRHARRGGALAPLLGDRYAGAPRFLKEIEMAGRLTAAGIPTPAVLAGVVYPRGALHRADVATQRVDGHDLAAICFGEAPPIGSMRTAIWQTVGGLVRRLHAAGFVHPDLQLRNVLVGEGRGNAWLIDVDTCRAVGATDTAARRANLARFDRSWEKWNARRGPRLTPEDRAEFLSAYRATP